MVPEARFSVVGTGCGVGVVGSGLMVVVVVQLSGGGVTAPVNGRREGGNNIGERVSEYNNIVVKLFYVITSTV